MEPIKKYAIGFLIFVVVVLIFLLIGYNIGIRKVSPTYITILDTIKLKSDSIIYLEAKKEYIYLKGNKKIKTLYLVPDSAQLAYIYNRARYFETIDTIGYSFNDRNSSRESVYVPRIISGISTTKNAVGAR